MLSGWWESGVTWSHVISTLTQLDLSTLEERLGITPLTGSVSSTLVTWVWAGVADCVAVAHVSSRDTLAVVRRRALRGADRCCPAAEILPTPRVARWQIHFEGKCTRKINAFAFKVVIMWGDCSILILQSRYKCCGVNVESSSMKGCTNIYLCCGGDQESEGCSTVCRKCGRGWGSDPGHCFIKPHNTVNKPAAQEWIICREIFIVVVVIWLRLLLATSPNITIRLSLK